MTTALQLRPRITLTQNDLSPDTLVLADGSLWSHAASLGAWPYQGTPLTIDRPLIDGFIRNFTAGMRRKIPVDYEHGTTNGATQTGHPVPKAGDVLELRGVYAATDFASDPSLKAAADRLAARAGRALDDAQNFGLWMRWRPTARALRMIQDGEYSELSIAFTGDTLYAVALTNLPFLTEMLPVAAFSGNGGDPAAPGSRERTMPNPILLSVTAAVTGATVQTDEEAQTRLNAFLPDFNRMRTFATDVGAEVGEADPSKAVTKIRELKAENTRFQQEATAAKKAALKVTVDDTMNKHEKKLTVPLKNLLSAQLTRELEAGTKLEETDTVKALTTMPELGIVDRASATDSGEQATDDVKLDTKAKELMNSDVEVKALTTRDGHSAGFRLALSKAAESLGLKRAPAGAGARDTVTT